MERLVREQQLVYDQLVRIRTNYKKDSKTRKTVSYLSQLRDKLNNLQQKYADTHRQILDTITGKDEEYNHPYFSEQKHMIFDEVLMELRVEIDDLMLEVQKPGHLQLLDVSGVGVKANNVEVRLPRIDLPSFDGSYENWTTFKDLFCSLIYSKESIPDVEKLQYLKCSLKGEAAGLLKAYPVTNCNLKLAWKTMVDRYDNPNVLANAQLKRLVNQEAINETAASIKSLLDRTMEAVQLLEAMQLENLWHALLIHLTVQRLPAVTRALWEQRQAGQPQLLTLEDLKQFLQMRFRTLEATFPNTRSLSQAPRKIQSHTAQTSITCCECLQAHKFRNCPKFTKANIAQRFEFAKKHRLCLNCLAKGHLAGSCPSPARCLKCKRLHHTMLHREAPAELSSIPRENYRTFPSPSAKPFTPNKVNALNGTMSSNILLATAIIELEGPRGRGTVRALLDQGSQASFVTEDVVQRFGFTKTASNMLVTGIGASGATRAKSLTAIKIITCEGDCMDIRALVLSKLTEQLPSSRGGKIQHPRLNGLKLADPRYHIPGRIDVIIGADVYGRLMLSQSEVIGEGLLMQHTKLGWVLSGIVPYKETTSVQAFRIAIKEQPTTEELLERFWKLEEPPECNRIKQEDEHCENFYKATTTRLASGRYMVRLPFQSEEARQALGSSRCAAEANLLSLEKKFLRNPELKSEYVRCIQEFIGNQHLEKVEQASLKEVHTSKYYLPHHAVQKDSSTTRTRIVFDASRKTTTGLSLNDVLLSGPSIQNDMVSIILNWRIWRYAYVADITKMYLQIKMYEEDRDFQRILWRADPSLPIDDYRFTTVTFGVTSAPYLAIRTLHELARTNVDRFPDVAATILRDFYVDDVLSGANSQKEAKIKIEQLIQVLKSAGFHLRKWVSNDMTILSNIPKEDLDSTQITDLNMDQQHKSLGILWNPTSDTRTYQCNINSNIDECTKRTVLSDIAKLYDPLGWISPVIIRAKCWMQKIWMRGIDWDEKLPDDMQQCWINLRNSLRTVEAIQIPRWIMIEDVKETELHGFCDASQEAYGVAVYCVSRGCSNVQSHLILSKTKVAPIKPVTIPRLELCGAVLLSNVMRQLLDTFRRRIDFTRTYLWTDSRIVLSWLRGHPRKWTVFVSNRTSQIFENVPNIGWRYVPSKYNPADVTSRGSDPHQLASNSLWWNGPPWLRETTDHWPDDETVETTDIELKLSKKVICHNALVKDSGLNELLHKYSNINRLLRVLAYCLRFCKVVRKRDAYRNHLRAEELNSAMNMLISFVQKTEFTNELQSLKHDKPLKKDSKLVSLNPFVDSDGIIRVGGRLAHANMSFDEKFPIILPRDGNFTKLLIEYSHLTTMHGDIQLMLSSLRKRFWILDARNLVKKCIHSCLKCYKTKAQAATQLMGSLPAPRVTISRPFTHVGVDYCGPISIKDRKGRGGRVYKGYIAIFICLAVKAIHIEVVNDLTTEAFLAAFRRFVARRGLCTHVYSDMGTNFVGASAEILRIVKANFRIAEYAENERINWHFNPPASPHFGGLWEAGVKSMKLHLRRTLGGATLTYEELCTTTCQIEACLNSRPLCQVYDDASEASVLTPAHFLIGDTMLSLPEANLLDMKENYLSRWQLTQRLTQLFWQRWSSEYLSRLQQRPKWVSREIEPRIGDICLIKDERLPSYKWPLARITDLHPGKDNIVRVVTLTKDNKYFKRNITKIAFLPCNKPE